MNFTDDQQHSRRPTLFGTILVLFTVLAAYSVVGGLLSMLVTGGKSLDTMLQSMQDSSLGPLLAIQGIGQILVLALPVFWLVSRLTGGGLFEKPALAWLGIGLPGGARPALMASAGMLLLQPALYTLIELQTLLLPHLGSFGKSLLEEQATFDLMFRKFSGGSSVADLLLSALVLVPTPAICEELFFRGYLQKSFALTLSPRMAVLITGILFALFHLEWFNLVPLTLLGWYIGYIYLKSGNFLVPAAAHGANNLAAFILLKSGLDSAGAGDAASGMLCFWQWWLLVAVTLFLFSLLIRRFAAESAMRDAK